MELKIPKVFRSIPKFYMHPWYKEPSEPPWDEKFVGRNKVSLSEILRQVSWNLLRHCTSGKENHLSNLVAETCPGWRVKSWSLFEGLLCLFTLNRVQTCLCNEAKFSAQTEPGCTDSSKQKNSETEHKRSVHVSVSTQRHKQRASDPLEQELQVVVSLTSQVLGTESRSFSTVVCALNH